MKKFIVLAGVGGFAIGVATGIVATKLASIVVRKVNEELDKIDFGSRTNKCDGCECTDDCEDCFVAACNSMECGCQTPKCEVTVVESAEAEATENEEN